MNKYFCLLIFNSCFVCVLQLRNLLAEKCLVAQGRPSQKGGTVVVRPCDSQDPEQVRV